MEKKKRWLFLLTFLFSLIAVCLLSASLGTEYWVVAHPVRIVDTNTVGGAKNVTGGDLDTKFKGYVNFGLFKGYKELDHGLGVRKGEILIECVESRNLCGWVEEKEEDEVKAIIEAYDDQIKQNGEESSENQDHGLFNFGLWVSTVIFAALGIVWGLVSMGFAVLNASVTPIETITGPLGLYLWNSLAMLFSLVCFILYLVLFLVDLQNNVLTVEDKTIYNWTSDGMADLNYSFYFVVIATVLYGANIAIVLLSGVECHPVRYHANMNEKALDGVMMY